MAENGRFLHRLNERHVMLIVKNQLVDFMARGLAGARRIFLLAAQKWTEPLTPSFKKRKNISASNSEDDTRMPVYSVYFLAIDLFFFLLCKGKRTKKQLSQAHLLISY